MKRLKPLAIVLGIFLLSVIADALYSNMAERGGQGLSSLNLLLVRIKPVVFVTVVTIILPFLVDLLFYDYEDRKLTFSLILTGVGVLVLLMPLFLGAYGPNWFFKSWLYEQVASSILNLTNMAGAYFVAIGLLRLLPTGFLAKIAGDKQLGE